MNYKTLFLPAISISLLTASPAFAQGQPPGAPPASRPDGMRTASSPADQSDPGMTVMTKTTPSPRGDLQTFAFEGAPLEVVMEEYCRWTGKIYLKTDAVKANITLKADRLTTEESIRVVEAILAMNNIALVPMGDKYLKVVQANAGDLVGQGLGIQMDPDHPISSTDNFITRIVQLQNVEIEEVQAAIQAVMHSYGKILSLQRSNSLMLTDTEANVKRAMDIIDFIDQATAQPESRIYQIEYAEASDIASKLTEIIEAAQGEGKTSGTSSSSRTTSRTAGVIRAGSSNSRDQRNTPQQTQASIAQTGLGSAAMISGTVKVLSDERTNIIIIFSQPDNFKFFDEIIEVLDVEVEPMTTVEVIHLEYADATDLSGTINDLIGSAGGSSSSRSSSGSSRTTASNSRSETGSRVTQNAAGGDASLDNLNRLSEDTKVLADERSNAILIMGGKNDIAVLKQLVKQLDIMLEQVVIEAAIFEIGLSESLSHGIDWLYRASDDDRVGAWDGTSLVTNSISTVASGALTYYQNLTGLDSQILINLAESDSDARLVSTPVIMTTDNTEASLTIAEQRPVVTSTSTYNNSSGTTSSNYEYKDIGIQLTVTPRVNPQRVVVMELTQSADQLGGSVSIDDNDVPIILNREFTASIAVPDRGTVALGGLIQTEYEDTVTKIPLLGDIPLIGRYLFSSVSNEEVQRELIVLMTPYVMTNPSEMANETERIYKGSSLKQKDWKGSWSDSPMRYIPDPVGADGDPASAKAQQTPNSDEVAELLNQMEKQ